MANKKTVSKEIIELIGFVLQTSEILEPLCDVFESEGKFYIDLEVAGLDLDNLKMEIDNDSLLVFGIKKKNSINNAKYVRAERMFGPFKKHIDFPHPVKEIDNVEYKKGILRIIINKR